MEIKHSGERLREKLAKRHIKPTDFASRMGVSTQVLNNWFTRGVPGRQMQTVCSNLEVNYNWLETGVGEEDSFPNVPSSQHPDLIPISLWDDDTPLDEDEVYVPFLKEVELSAGSGKSTIQQSNKQKLRFGKITLRRQGVQPSEAVCVTVSGNSMEPVLPHGSTVGVDTGTTNVIDGKMYALAHAGQLRVKTLYRIPGGGIRLRSFNREEHDDEDYTAEEMIEQEITILGRVFWSSALW